MIDLAQRFAAADPATTPPDAPLPDEALALLDRVMTPRAPRPSTAAAERPSAIPRGLRLPRLAIGILIPAIVLAGLGMLGLGWFAVNGFGPGPTEATAEPSAAPSLVQEEFTSEGALVAASEAIITASTLDLGILDDSGARYYIATVRVISAAKGPYAPGDELEIAFPDPGPDDADWPPGLRRGEKALLFLRYDVPAANAGLINPTQGSYLLLSTGTGPKPVGHPENPLTLDPTFLERMGLRVS